MDQKTKLLIDQFSPNWSKNQHNLKQNPRWIFFSVDKLSQKFIKKMQNTRIAKVTLKKNKARGLNVNL